MAVGKAVVRSHTQSALVVSGKTKIVTRAATTITTVIIKTMLFNMKLSTSHKLSDSQLESIEGGYSPPSNLHDLSESKTDY